MKNGKIHLIISTLICAMTMLLFLAFSSKLPADVPVQITSKGSVGNTMPKNIFIFGLPTVFVIINLARGLKLINSEKTSIHSYYIIPIIVVILSVITLWMGINL